MKIATAVLLIACAAVGAGVASGDGCETKCSTENLHLVDVSCNPPHGGGPDGRAWFFLACGEVAAPVPYDWQLAELGAAHGFIFAWNQDPRYAFVEGENGSYQAGALTQLGEVNSVFAMPAGSRCDVDRPWREE